MDAASRADRKGCTMTNLTRRSFLLGFLGAAGALGLAGCGNTGLGSGKLSQEKMLEQAEELDLEAFHSLNNKNEAKAKQEYDGKIFVCTAYVGDISTTDVEIGQVILGEFCNTLKVELPEEELASLSSGQEITVCGKFQYVAIVSRLVDAFVVE